tara:strand:+ start:1137 stop:2966 length:1830 start_codon:yes stop_codon:yes gene_type:complete
MTIEAKLKNGTILRFPDGTDHEVIKNTVKRIMAEERSPSGVDTEVSNVIRTSDGPEMTSSMGPGQQALRAAEFASRGVSDSAADLLALPGEGVRAIGRGLGLTNEPYGKLQKATKEGFRDAGRLVTNLTGVNNLTNLGPNTPQSALEHGAYGAGRGAVDAATMMLPGGVITKLAKPMTTLSNVGKVLKTQPGVQLASGSVGGGTAASTDSDIAGLAASLMTPFAPNVFSKTVGKLGRKLVTPSPSQLSKNEQALVKEAESLGIKLTPGQKTGGPSLRTIESSLTQLPFTGAKQSAIYGDQAIQFNRAVLKTAGINSNDASPATIESAFTKLSSQFDDLASKTQITVDKKLDTDLAEVAENFTRRLSPDDKTIIKTYVDDLEMVHRKLAGNAIIPGTEYQQISSALKSRARSASGKDALFADTLYQIANKLDDAVARSGGKELKSAWKDIRNKYRNLLIIDNAVKGAGAVDLSAANVPMMGLKNSAKKFDQSGFSRGRGELNKLSRVGVFLRSAIPPDSGTARRNWGMNLLTGGGLTGGLAIGADVTTVAAAALATLGAPKLAQTVMSNKYVQKYLSNQAMLPPEQRKITTDLLLKLAGAQAIGDNIEGE